MRISDWSSDVCSSDLIDELYADVSTEYKRLPNLHADLWTIFKPVKNRADIEQYRQLLVPQTCESEDGTPIDHNQKIREDFYEALTAYGMCLDRKSTRLNSSH